MANVPYVAHVVALNVLLLIAFQVLDLIQVADQLSFVFEGLNGR
jgi:hypothetical protein